MACYCITLKYFKFVILCISGRLISINSKSCHNISHVISSEDSSSVNFCPNCNLRKCEFKYRIDTRKKNILFSLVLSLSKFIFHPLEESRHIKKHQDLFGCIIQFYFLIKEIIYFQGST